MHNPHNIPGTSFSLISTEIKMYGENLLQEYLKHEFITNEEADTIRQVMKQEIESDDVLMSMCIVFGDMEYFKRTALTEEDISTRTDVLRTDTLSKVIPYKGTFTPGLKKYDDETTKNKMIVDASMENEFTLVVEKSAMTQYINPDDKRGASYSIIWMYLPLNRIQEKQ